MNYEEALELELTPEEQEELKPFWKLNQNDEEEILKWLRNEFKYLSKINREHHTRMMENLLIYKGVQFSPNETKTINDFLDTSRRTENRRKQKLIVNHLYDLTETVVSRVSRSNIEPEVLPANSEEIHDRNAAKSVKKLIDHITYINKLPKKKINLRRQTTQTGEGYLSVLWNKDNGDISPLWAAAKEEGFKNSKGEDILDENGKKLDPNNPMKVGEVELLIREAWKVLLEDVTCYEKVDYCFIVDDLENIEKIKEDYPKKADKIKAYTGDRIWDTRHMTFRKPRNEAIKIHFFHRNTKYFPKGIHVIFTLDALLEKENYPYKHGSLPVVRLTDVDLEGELHAESSYEQVKNLQWRHNQITSDIVTNQRLCAKPKWIVPKGRVSNITSLGNESTIVQYSGVIAPKLVSFNPTPQELFIFRKDLKEDMGQLMTVSSTSRGQPPAGARAAVSMKFLSELEAERVSVATAKDNDFMKELYIQIMSVAGSNYKADDGRTMRVLGNDQEYHMSDVIISNLSKPYDVIIKEKSGQGELKAIKQERIFEVLKVKPDILPDERLVESLELGTLEKASSIITEALRAAENENEKFFNSEEVLEPAEYEDSIIHWRTHLQKMQSGSLKVNARIEDFESLEEHVWMTEFLMMEKAKENSTFQAELAKLSLFPVFYKEGQEFRPSSLEQQKAVVQGQANRGEEITENIGADLTEEQEENK